MIFDTSSSSSSPFAQREIPHDFGLPLFRLKPRTIGGCLALVSDLGNSELTVTPSLERFPRDLGLIIACKTVQVRG